MKTKQTKTTKKMKSRIRINSRLGLSSTARKAEQIRAMCADLLRVRSELVRASAALQRVILTLDEMLQAGPNDAGLVVLRQAFAG